MVQQLFFVLVNWVETNSSLFLLKSFVLKQKSLSWRVYNLLVMQSEIGPLSKSPLGAFCSPGNREACGLCANRWVSALGCRVPVDSASFQGPGVDEAPQSLLPMSALPVDPDGPKHSFSNLASLRNHLDGLLKNAGAWTHSKRSDLIGHGGDRGH